MFPSSWAHARLARKCAPNRMPPFSTLRRPLPTYEVTRAILSQIYHRGHISPRAFSASHQEMADTNYSGPAQTLPTKTLLEATAAAASDKKEKKKKKKKAEPAAHSTRLIALKFAYLGKNYNGYEYQTNGLLTTIEEELWKALTKSCLIRPENPDELNFTPFEYSKCGRTDRGVSAFGQVITIRVRSNRPLPKKDPEPSEEDAEKMNIDGKEVQGEQKEAKREVKKPEWDPIRDEIQYCKVLNRLLPPDIRMLAWCGDLPEGFVARFSCRERQYRYFFTQPAYSPPPEGIVQTKPGAVKEGWLDIEAMRKAAKLYEGLHDFRNFCKVDMKKQVSMFHRRIFEADIVEVEDVESALPYLSTDKFKPQHVMVQGSLPKVYYFHVRGSAFLWHQIRHMVSVLFLVGQGYERPEVITELLDVKKYPGRPNYIIADDSPLVLWDCIFPELESHGTLPEYDEHNFDLNMKDAVNWIYAGEDDPTDMYGNQGLMTDLWEHWRAKKMDELLANRLLDMVSKRAGLNRTLAPSGPHGKKREHLPKVFLGGHQGTNVGRYVPMDKKQVLPTPEEVNNTYAQKVGFASSEEMAQTTNWRTVIKANKKEKEAAAAAAAAAAATVGKSDV
ncbi:hypothetical protein DL546_003603 [Coniochaeta pulveracea]|uniref:Pseudouridine synthase I TruA alpha/beta domain-containing protein n=1 Tax=Coniochaeta pulveracea TaxID=177199 RepID=A0A420YGD8_9PEZI|nr:hypothetical protein DL546_003603 [Coniochaeta pulveracea]